MKNTASHLIRRVFFRYTNAVYVKPEKIVFGGNALARIDGKAVFIPFALPGELLDVQLITEHRDYAEAVIKKILEPSPHRVEPRCPYFMQCGGCNLQMADDGCQKTLRFAMVSEMLVRAGLHPEHEPQLVAGKDWEYRSRFQFHYDRTGKLGMCRNGTHTVIEPHDCPIAHPLIRKALQDGRLKELLPKNRIKGTRGHLFGYDRIYGPLNPEASVRIGGTVLGFNAAGFFQSNIEMLEKLIPFVCSLNGCRRVLDFYAGVGTFSAFLTADAEEIHLVEHNKQALRQAEKNLSAVQKERHTQCRCFFHALSDADWPKIPAAQLPFDAAIIDPPRQGMHPDLISYLAAAAIERIHYVSCNPATFVRDAQKLTALGYRFIEWQLFDFYPQTHHSELLGTFVR